MVEKYFPIEENIFAQECPEDNVIHVDFRPKISRQEILRRIGEKAMIGWQPDLNVEVLSSEPLHLHEDEDGNIDVTFKQYQRGYSTDTCGTPHSYGWSGGTETLRILNIHWDAGLYSVSSEYVQARNFRYQLIEVESQRRYTHVNEELRALRRELWDEP